MVPPLPHARESKGWPAQRQNVTRAADFAGILAWRQIGAPEFSGNAPATFPPGSPEERKRGSGCEQVNPPYSGAAATALHRLPVHEVCGGCGGAAPTAGWKNRWERNHRVKV